jgi:hypothetical protein
MEVTHMFFVKPRLRDLLYIYWHLFLHKIGVER